jgi:hypothetical protein
MARINLPGSGHIAPPATAGYQWLPFSDPTYLAAVQRAFGVIDARVKGHEPCNAAFKALPGGRSFVDLWNDPSVWVSFDPDGRATSFGGTLRNEISVSQYACRMGHWTLVATLIHELAHVGGVHGENNTAEATLKACLMRAHYNPFIIGSLTSSAQSSTLVAANKSGYRADNLKRSGVA